MSATAVTERPGHNRPGSGGVTENESVQIPGTVSTFDLRAQDPHGPFGGPMLSLVSGQYPATADQIAVTSGVATDFKLSIGSNWTVGGVTRKVTGIVQNPQNLVDNFALVMPGQVSAPDYVKVLFDAPGAGAGSGGGNQNDGRPGGRLWQGYRAGSG
jgi:putative ABC transport system permease protein